MTQAANEVSLSRGRSRLNGLSSVLDRVDAAVAGVGRFIWRAMIEGLATYATTQYAPGFCMDPYSAVEQRYERPIDSMTGPGLRLDDAGLILNDFEDFHAMIRSAQPAISRI
jgi:hypothetical protein